jgi:prophage tail gpP-like protein
MPSIAPDSEDLTILTGGKRIGGWLGVRVSRGVERLPSGFSLELTELYPGHPVAEVTPGSTCEVYLGSDKVLTGFVDVYEPRYAKEENRPRLMGRSKTEDLVDCSLISEGGVKSWEFKAATIGEAADRICEPFGITVAGDGRDAKLDPKQPFTLQPGMTCAQMLEEMAQNAQVLMWDDPDGRLLFSHVGTTRAGTALVEGMNVEIGHARLSMDQRYSDIWVLGQMQQPPPGPDTLFHMDPLGKSKDSGVTRHRPLLLIMDYPGPDGKWAQDRADWQVARRRGRAQVVEITVTGWRDGDGKLWTPNTMVSVQCPTLKVKQDMVIAHVSWVRGDLGTETVLTCMPKEGLSPAPFHFQPVVSGAIIDDSGNLKPGQ